MASAIKEVEEPPSVADLLGHVASTVIKRHRGPGSLLSRERELDGPCSRLACFDLSDGPGSTERTAEVFSGSDIAGPPWKASENWGGRMVRCLFLSEVSKRSVALRRGYSVK